MEAIETQEVLDTIAGYDGRTWTEGAVDAWHAILYRYPFADALQAVHEHYATHEKRIMPVNIRARAIQLADIRANAERRALPAPAAPAVTEVGLRAKAAIRALTGQIAARTDAGTRAMPADMSTPTAPDSGITEAAKREQMQRLAALVRAS